MFIEFPLNVLALVFKPVPELVAGIIYVSTVRNCDVGSDVVVGSIFILSEATAPIETFPLSLTDCA